MPTHPPDLGRRVAITHNGLRVVGAARELFSGVDEPTSVDLRPGRSDDALFGVRLTLRSHQKQPIVPTVLDALTRFIRDSGVELPALEKGVPVSIEPTRTAGVVWRDGVESRAWSGELIWRAAHPTVRGGRVTHHVVLEERPHYDRLTLRITADDGVESVRRWVGAGQVRPAWLDELADQFTVGAWGSGLQARSLDELVIEDFVRTTLLGRRDYPVAVLAPRDDGSYALEPNEVAGELMGIAPLYVIDRHASTFRLTDTVGDKRLSCFFGALRIFMPGFTASDDPHDHPLLVQDRLVDPVMRAAEIGRAAMFVAQRLEMPDPFGWEVVEPEPAPDLEVAIDLSLPAAIEADAAPPDEDGGAGAVPRSIADVPESAAVALPAGAGSTGTDAASPAPERPPPSAELQQVLERVRQNALLLQANSALLQANAEQLRRVHDTQAQILMAITRLTEETERVRTLTNVRSAGTAALERQITRLRDVVEARLPPELTWTVPADSHRDPAGVDAVGEALAADELLAAVEAAAEAWPDDLLVLPQALVSAADSPYEDAQRVHAVLEAMAAVARRRMAGGLGVPLREAFREFGVDYRGGISDSTSARLREQYRFVDPESPEAHEYDCVEHIALGNSRDARYCLRIYFTSRAKAENRFVIGHIGRHFEIGMTN
ncbi:hypothetical protein WI460_12760 [Gemmatimonadota bacterium Y43]|uniref:hypothetical protein n=1 Tax=Gaopeijia maritima TaxID=3119007 RepID=UPI003283AA71